ncbi:sulfotransferase 2B1-like [Bufo bufo]|uniref:sulfotransferase 2B1-like n=1 Tax=Bufo bufo TaxID=8384 RepID=UPI001ABE3EA5|nr:sulfotransferase 2B1-like [Bufo bufo]
MEVTRQYITFEGIRVPYGVHTEESLTYAWKEFETRDDDVFNVTYPKSGTTWVQEIFSLIYSNGDPTPVKTSLSWDRVPWLEQHSGRKQLENRPSPRLITTHLPFHLFPQSFFKTKAKVVYTIRDPRDICVSLFYFSKIAQFMEYKDDFQDFVSLFLSKDIIFGGWFKHVKGWLTIKDNPNLLILSYEDLIKDLKGNVIKISKFLGKELDDAAIDSVVEHSSFQAMKANPMSNYCHVPNDIFDKNIGAFHRKGIAGDHKNHFTPGQKEEFEKIYNECMKDINVSLT